jgi:hypothetical protein
MTVTKPKLKNHRWGAMHDKVRVIAQALHNGQKPDVKTLATQFKCTTKYVYMLISEARKMTGIAKPPSKRGMKSKNPALPLSLSKRKLRMHESSMELPITMEEPKAEMVNSPAHYTVGGIETIDYIQAKLTPDEFRGYLKGNVIKYTSRAQYKEYPEEDIDKMVWYALKLQSIKN